MRTRILAFVLLVTAATAAAAFLLMEPTGPQANPKQQAEQVSCCLVPPCPPDCPLAQK